MNVSEVHDEIRREMNLEMLAIRSLRSGATDWLFLTGMRDSSPRVPLENEK
jgi:hypothetical protein